MLWALLRQYVRPYRRLLAVVATLQVISTLASLYLPTVNAAIIDDGVAKGDTRRIVELGGVMLAVTGLQVACAIGAVFFGSRAAMGFGRDLRCAIFHHVTTFSAEETARFGAPSLLTRTTNDVGQIQQLLQMTATILITAPIMSIGGILMALHQDAGLSWLLLISVPVLALTNFAIIRHLMPIFRRMQRLIDGINRVMRDQLSGIRVIRAFAREPVEGRRFADANQALSATALEAGRWQALMLPATTLVINVSSVALIWFGGLRIDAGHMQVGSLIAFLAYFMQILMAVLMAAVLAVMLPRASVCAERVSGVLSTRPRITTPAHPVRPQTLAGEITFDDASFSYPGADRPVLQQVSLRIPPGTTTAVVGSTGSGKSTLLAMICRFYDVSSGSVRVDGHDVRELDLEQLWATIGLVPQRGYLFSGTIAENLRYGAVPGQELTDEQMWEALRIAAADDFVAAHPDGLDRPVAQGGINFSGGQRQRLAIARAVIRRPPIYLFDDAFSALDVHTDARVRAALREVSADATVVIVSQRISTVMEADQVVVVADGRIVGTGTHESLLTECPTYAEFAASQAITAGDPR
ncbi:ABC transporter ATP-binding protein [Mycolicibacterium conceptionense]|jgi:ATP-binding cassette subfamily B multidrug efflux pump|uniref:ABC transporter ATP-binding protein n=2 Tax=Mycolicibacterium TaxID=1866885 RepID=A0ABR5G2A3_9MYCO|nr:MULTISPECIES: ABC transporter ATP-binding protein [Mycolicibacterium]KLI05487.1 ABC transporter ATP-binding protein [Mycolicibacterium senegalense]KLO54341.1 ABC transporter ATP-binding protein [Mycolicibacterium senegalense]KMV16032.1 ABC transporter ATP-binding protein [Mycolicibacterium conceptionense]OBK02723.1 ABC transporter ATP-binding protein [Mycolicibacterium conceptionense]OMB83067.1 ABC transporter ATP-binding protein [Mycolicibacterium conceptionense]